jgi:hypothetical protein
MNVEEIDTYLHLMYDNNFKRIYDLKESLNNDFKPYFVNMIIHDKEQFDKLEMVMLEASVILHKLNLVGFKLDDYESCSAAIRILECKIKLFNADLHQIEHMSEIVTAYGSAYLDYLRVELKDDPKVLLFRHI